MQSKNFHDCMMTPGTFCQQHSLLFCHNFISISSVLIMSGSGSQEDLLKLSILGQPVPHIQLSLLPIMAAGCHMYWPDPL